MPIRRKRPAKAAQESTTVTTPKKRTARARPRPKPEAEDTTQTQEMKDEEYTVGYGKPPKSTRFKKGKSGNPNGRPKGAKGLNSIVKLHLLERVAVRTGKGTKRITRIEALVLKLLEAAGNGEHRALVQLMSMYSAAVPDASPDQDAAGSNQMTETDEAILAQFLAQQAKLEETTS